MGASTSKNDIPWKAPYDYGDSPRKRRKTDGDEEADRRLALSSVKVEAKPVHSSPEVLELRQHLLMAKQAQINAEQLVINTAQKLLDTKQRAARKEEMYQSELREAVQRAEQAEKELGSAREAEQWGKEKFAQLKKELEDEKKKGSERENSIAKLRRILVQYGPNEQEVNAAVRSDHSMDFVADNTNILSLLLPNARNAISLDEAVKWVRSSYGKCGDIAKARFAAKRAAFDCRVCGIETRNKLAVTTHFLSEEHIGKVRASGARVSKIAICNWANMLDHWAKFGK